MFKVNTLVSLCILALAVPSVARAGLNVYPADGPAPVVHVEPPKPLEYKIQKGDTVAVIAKKFSVDTKTLMSANGLTDPRKLQAGKTLQIPGKTAPAAPAAPVGKPGGQAAPAAAQVAATPTPSAASPAAASSAPAATPAKTGPVVAAAPPLPAKEIVADAKARHSKEAVDPGVDEGTPTRGKRRGKKGKFAEPPLPPPPTIEIDDKLRACFGKTGVIMNNTDVPQAIRDEFYRYAIKWLDELETLGVGTYAHKRIHQVGDQWEASYRIVIRESLGAEVKKVNHEAEDTPYVGHITYVQRVFTAVGPTRQAALAGPYTQKDECIREIFSYSGKKKAWR